MHVRIAPAQPIKHMKKECPKHGLVRFRIEGKKRIRHRCVKCASEFVSSRRKKLKLLAVEYKGGKCERCGYNKCINSLAFHHLDPQHKDFGIAHRGLTRSFEKLKIELDKCVLVCHNCHGEIHDTKHAGESH